MKAKRNNSQLMKMVLNSFFCLAILSGLIAFSSCKTTKKTASKEEKIKLVKTDTTNIASDSTEYELIVLDPGYESFLATQPPADYHSQDYYENWNQRYVLEWNSRYDNPMQYGDFYQTRIEYDPTTDYGLELNYRLYYYFRFIEKEYGIELLPRGQ